MRHVTVLLLAVLLQGRVSRAETLFCRDLFYDEPQVNVLEHEYSDSRYGPSFVQGISTKLRAGDVVVPMKFGISSNGFSEIEKRYGPETMGLPVIKNKVILDAGCGPGNLVKDLLQKDVMIFGSDLYLEPGLKGITNFVKEDSLHSRFPDHSFDIIVSTSSLLGYLSTRAAAEKIPDEVRIRFVKAQLVEFKRLLTKKKGYILVSRLYGDGLLELERVANSVGLTMLQRYQRSGGGYTGSEGVVALYLTDSRKAFTPPPFSTNPVKVKDYYSYYQDRRGPPFFWYSRQDPQISPWAKDIWPND